MTSAAEHERANAGRIASVVAQNQQHQPPGRWYYTAAGVLAIPLVFFSFPDQSLNELAQIERLAPKIERAAVLSSEASDTIGQLLARQRALLGKASGALEARRRNAIDRIGNALRTKQAKASSIGGSETAH